MFPQYEFAELAADHPIYVMNNSPEQNEEQTERLSAQ